MKALGAHTFGTVWTHDAASAIEALAPLGFRDFQLMAMVPHLDPWTAADVVPRIKRALNSCGGRIVAIDLPSSDLNIASTTPAAVEFAVATYAKAMVLGRELGASWLTVNSGRKHMLLPPPDDRLIAIYAAALMRLSEQAQDCGMRILIENIPGCLLDTAEALAGFLDSHVYPNVDVLYDVANAAAVREDPVHGLTVLGSRVAVVHLSDAPKGLSRHAPIGSGDIDFAAMKRKLIEIDYGGEIVLEIISDDAIRDFSTSREVLGRSGWLVADARDPV